MSMGQSQESTNIDETKETIKREVLDFIAQYGCGKAPDEAFDTLAKHIFAFQFERNLPYRAYCMSKRVTPQTLANWMQIPPMPVDGFKMLTLTSVPEQDCEAVFTTSGTTHPGRGGCTHRLPPCPPPPQTKVQSRYRTLHSCCLRS